MKKLLVLMMIVVLSACSGEKEVVVKSGLNEEYVEDKQDYVVRSHSPCSRLGFLH